MMVEVASCKVPHLFLLGRLLAGSCLFLLLRLRRLLL